MKPGIYAGQVKHRRLKPIDHGFDYPFYFYLFDLDELDDLSRAHWVFGYNKTRLLSLKDRDYLDGKWEGRLKDGVKHYLEQAGLSVNGDRVYMVTAARFLNYVFNPVSFFIVADEDNAPRTILAEVNNTFGERHLYVVPELKADHAGFRGAVRQKKSFHVSPFNDMDGDYAFRLRHEEDRLELHVDLYKDGKPFLLASMEGNCKKFSNASVLRTILQYPLTAILTMPRILTQATKLYWKKKLPVYTKPEPDDAMTIIHQRRGWMERFGAYVFHIALSGIQKGSLAVAYPDGRIRHYGAPSDDAPLLNIRHRYFFKKLVAGGDVGFGEAYVEGFWDSDDLAGVMRVLARNNKQMEEAEGGFALLGKFADRVGHLLRKNHILNSRKNISEHYDLSNEFYRLWLDPMMVYSAGVWNHQDESLEEAQYNKLDMMIDKARIGPDHHLLEIGTGWGALAIRAAKRTGCRVTTITLSEEQAAEARKRIQAEGLQDQIEVRIQDYRHLEGTFDRLISIEMLEAVGEEYLSTFFEKIDEVLAPDGIAVIQVITMPDDRYKAYRRKCDWIQKHVFPGGHLPSVSVMLKAMRKTSWVVEHLENIGLDYAETLRRWADQFKHHRVDIEALGFDKNFQRKWLYYLAYCEAGFDERIINDLQVVLSRPGNPALD